MSSEKYTYNADRGRYEVHRTSLGRKVGDVGVMTLIGVAIFLAYTLLNGRLFSLPSPKEMVLSVQNARLTDKIEYLGQRAARQAARLAELEMRDNRVYRPVFGMDEIPSSVRNAPYTAPGRYSEVARFSNADFLTGTLRRQDIIEKKAYLQSRSYDEVEKVAARAEDMARYVPTLFPVCPSSAITVTSPFGYRLHPIFQTVFFHSGTDIGGPQGTPIYAAADGVVSEVKYSDGGYGNEVDIDHGFGYSTRYAHLLGANVVQGQKVRRGDQIATMGSSGRAPGVHLHYEVFYKDTQVNPANFFDKNIDPKAYMEMVTPADKIQR